jgi:hypothetical protein
MKRSKIRVSDSYLFLNKNYILKEMLYMANLVHDSETAFNIGNIHYHDLMGLNSKGSARSKIRIQGTLDPFTTETLYKNYDLIASNLKVYPTIVIYGRDRHFEGGFTGFYNTENNHIQLIDNYYLISNLAHEMRHAYQYIYFPDLFYADEFNTTIGYLNANTERDARTYSFDYCATMNYTEEARYVSDNEEIIDLVIRGLKPPSVMNLDDAYFRSNPHISYTVSRDYHISNQQTQYVESTQPQSFLDTCLEWIGGGLAIGFLIFIVMLGIGFVDKYF